MVRPEMHVIDCGSLRTGKVSTIESRKQLAIIKWHDGSKEMVAFNKLYHNIGYGVLEYAAQIH